MQKLSLRGWVLARRIFAAYLAVLADAGRAKAPLPRELDQPIGIRPAKPRPIPATGPMRAFHEWT